MTTTTEIENFPGYPDGIDGNALMEDLRQQAGRFGTEFRTGIIVESQLDKAPFRLKLDDGKEVLAQTVIIATGATARYLGLESEERFKDGRIGLCHV